MNKLDTIRLWLKESCELNQELKDIILLGVSLVEIIKLYDGIVADLSDNDYQTLLNVKSEGWGNDTN